MIQNLHFRWRWRAKSKIFHRLSNRGYSGHVVHPRRWVVEHTFAWLNRSHRLAKDFEQTIRSASAFLYAASAMVIIRRLAHFA